MDRIETLKKQIKDNQKRRAEHVLQVDLCDHEIAKAKMELLAIDLENAGMLKDVGTKTERPDFDAIAKANIS